MTSTTEHAIVVGIDGSERSRVALQWAAGLARSRGLPLSAVSAWNYPAALMMPMVGAPALPADDFRDAAQQRLDATIESTPTDPAVTDRHVVMGSPRSVLTEATEGATSLVMGRTGTTRVTRAWLGSTAAYCVRHAECPVVITHDTTELEHKIVVAVDGSESSVEALVWALSLGDDHEITAVFSHDEWELDELSLDDDLRASLDRRAGEILNDAVLDACAKTGKNEAAILREVRSGDPRSTIVENGDPDALLVLGAHGHSGLARWILGSLADFAVNHAPGTVVIVR
jgi:nucleotide-binding universal stress UspA family protein